MLTCLAQLWSTVPPWKQFTLQLFLLQFPAWYRLATESWSGGRQMAPEVAGNGPLG